jgi:hypothetical protein
VYSEVVYHQTTENRLRCLESAFWYFGGVSQTIMIDNLKAAVPQADWYDPDLHPKIQSFCQHYGTVILEAAQKAKAIACLPDLSLPESRVAVATGTDGRGILRDSYPHGKRERKRTELSGSRTANSASESAISDDGEGSGCVRKALRAVFTLCAALPGPLLWPPATTTARAEVVVSLRRRKFLRL